MAHINPQTMKIFIVHYKKLVHRKAHIIRELNTHNITNYEFIQIDRDELTAEDCNKFTPFLISNAHFEMKVLLIFKYKSSGIIPLSR